MGLKDVHNMLDRDRRQDDRSSMKDRLPVSVYNPTAKEHPRRAVSANTYQEKEVRPESFQESRRKSIFIGAMVALGLVLFGIGMISYLTVKGSAFRAGNVVLEIAGPNSIDSNTEATYEVSYHNKNRLALEGVKLIVQFPDSFMPDATDNFTREGISRGVIDVGDIGGNNKGTIPINGRFFGAEDEISYINTVLVYSPSGTTSTFEVETQIAVKVLSSSLDVELVTPIEVANADEFEFKVRYVNDGADTYFATRLTLDYPDNFTFTVADPIPQEGEDTWIIGDLDPGGSGEVSIRGMLTVGNQGQIRQFGASLGYVSGDNVVVPYVEHTTDVLIIQSPLTIRHDVEDQAGSANVRIGQSLLVTLRYENTGDIGLRNANIMLEFKGDSFLYDLAGLELDSGSLNSDTKTITWRAADVPALASIAPGEGGSVRFRVPIKDKIYVENPNDTRFSAYTVASIDSPDVPGRVGAERIVGKDQFTVYLNTNLSSNITATEKRSGESIKDYMPRIGQPARYRVTWKLSNLYNDVTSVVAQASIPSNAILMGIVTDEEPFEYNDRTQQLVWEVGRMDHGEGILSDPREFIFDVEFTPSEDQERDRAEVLANIEVVGYDSFTKEEVRVEEPSLKTNVIRK